MCNMPFIGKVTFLQWLKNNYFVKGNWAMERTFAMDIWHYFPHYFFGWKQWQIPNNLTYIL